MEIIALEGLDKCGKFSQTTLLYEFLKSLGYKVERSEFHNYDSPTGKLIMDWLTKEWDVCQTTIEFIMAANKQAQQRWFNELENNGTDFLILDRYTRSQIAYGLASGSDEPVLLSLLSKIRKPDLDIIIDIPAEVSMARKGKHNNGENDRYESDINLLRDVRTIYKNISSHQSAPIMEIVDGMGSIEEVSIKILEVVERTFHIKNLLEKVSEK